MADEPKKPEISEKVKLAVYEANLKLGTEQSKVLSLVNAGAIVVLLAFLQAIIPPENKVSKDFISIIPFGMICYTLGLMSVLFIHFFRISGRPSTYFFQMPEDNSKLVHTLFFVSGAFFILGSAVIIYGAIRYL